MWQGRRVKLVDGTTVTIPDTQDNRKRSTITPLVDYQTDAMLASYLH